MNRSIILTCLVLVLLLASAAAFAAVNGPLIVTASNDSGKRASWTYDWGSSSSCNLTTPVTLTASDGTVLGVIQSLNCSMIGDPVLTLNFAVQSVGSANFFFDTGEFFFPQIAQPVAFATAAATLTAGSNGGTLTGAFTGGNAYEATYNSGTVFADLDSTFNSPANTSTTESERVPGVDFAAIGVPVSSMRAQWSFNLTDDDGASGTSRYEIQPVPDAGTLSLALSGAIPLLGGLAIRRRKRA